MNKSAAGRRSPEHDRPDMRDLRIVLLGKNVSENNRVGNTILGTTEFHSLAPSSSQQHNQRVSGVVEKRNITVINTSPLLQPDISHHQIKQTVRECVSLSVPGPHVILLVLQYNDFREEDMRRVKTVLNLFSQKAIKHTIVLTTDEETRTLMIYKNTNNAIRNLIKECGGRHLQFDRNNAGWRSEMIRRIEDILREEHEEFLICNMFEEEAPEGVKLNLVVCGSDRRLKSFISNLILNQRDRRSELSSECVRRDVKVCEHLISLVELPALIKTQLSEEEVMRQTLRCVSLCDPGVHVFIIIIPDAPLTDEDKAEMEKIQRMFSSRIKNYTMVLIHQNPEHQTAELNEETQCVIESFGGRHHFIGPNTQVSMLMEKLMQMVEENSGVCFSTETLLEAQMEKLQTFEEMKRKIHSLETWFQTQDSRDSADDLRIVLLGKTGVGKSATGNTILGRETFISDTSQKSITKVCQKKTVEINGRHVTVIDTPGLFDTELTNEEIKREITNCISMILPGPHAFLLLIPVGRFTQEEAKAVKIIQDTFGENSLLYTIVLFTRGDDLKKKTIEQWLGDPEPALKNLIEACGNRFHVFNNNQTGDRTQVSDLLKKIDDMVKANGDSYYSCKMFREMEREKQEQQMKILMETVEQLKREKDELMNKHEEEMKKVKMTMEEEIQNHDKNLKKKEEEFREKEEQYKRDIKESEKQEREIREELKREREEWERQKQEEKQRREEEDERRRKKEQEMRDEFNQEKERMKMMEEERQNHDKERKRREQEDERRRKIDKETWDEYYEKLKRERERRQREREDLQFKHEEEMKRVKMMMEEDRENNVEEKKRREEEYRQREERHKRYIKDIEDHEREIREEMKREREEGERQKQQERQREETHNTDIHSQGDEEPPSDSGCLRILLFGRTGNGKSATANTILRTDEFHSEASSHLVTTNCKKGVVEVDGKSVSVVDTPGLFDLTLTYGQVVQEIMKCVSLSAPGPHVFIIVLRVGRITQEKQDTLDMIKKIFGPKAAEFSIVLFTRGDDLRGQTIEQYVEKSNNDELKKLIRACGNRFLAFNNTETQDRTQVTQLLNMIEELKKSNEGRYFTSEMFEAAISIEKRREMLKENKRKKQAHVEELEAKYDMEEKRMRKKLKEKKQKTDEERVRLENKFREKEETLKRKFEEKEKSELKKLEEEDQKRPEEEKHRRAEYDQRIDEMKREIESQRLQYENEQKKREEENRKREEEYRQDQEKMKTEQEHIIAELRKKQEEEIKKRDSEEQMRKEREEKEREEWKRKIKEAENDEDIKRKQREWEEEKKRQMREREEEEREMKERHEEQLREKQEELEKMRERFETQREEEEQMIEEEKQKQIREREEKEREYEGERKEMKRCYEQLERERKEEWERRKREDEERRREKRKRWEKMIEDLKREQEEEIKRREREERERIRREEKECDKMKQKHEEEIKEMKKKHQDEARKHEEELNKFRKREEQHEQEFKETLGKLYELKEKQESSVFWRSVKRVNWR